MKLHVIGECHAYYGWCNIKQLDVPQFEEINLNAIGTFTMSGFGFHKLGVLDISKYYIRTKNRELWKTEPESIMPNDEKRILDNLYPYQYDFNINNGDFVIISMGEVDIRSHLSAEEYTNTWQETIDKIVPEYFEALKANRDNFNHIYLGVYNVIPPVRGHWNHGEEREIRKLAMSKYMNTKLKEYCEKYNYIFVDVYDKYCDDDGFLRDELSHSVMHIGNPVYLIEFLNNLNLS